MVTHLLFIDDIIIFSDGLRRELNKLTKILDIHCTRLGMAVNEKKSSIMDEDIGEDEMSYIRSKLPYTGMRMDEGLKYLVF